MAPVIIYRTNSGTHNGCNTVILTDRTEHRLQRLRPSIAKCSPGALRPGLQLALEAYFFGTVRKLGAALQVCAASSIRKTGGVASGAT